MVEKPTAATTTDNAQQQNPGTTTVSKGAGGEAYPGQDKDVVAHAWTGTWDAEHNAEAHKNDWNKQHPDHPFATADAYLDAAKAAALRAGFQPDKVEQTIRDFKRMS